jgi:hypothetical protein
MKTFIKHPSPIGNYSDSENNKFLVIEIPESANFSSNHPSFEAESETEAASLMAITKTELSPKERNIPQNPIPNKVTPRQLRLALLKNGVNPSAISQAIQAIPDENIKQAALIEWEYAIYFERSHPLINSMASQLGMQASTVDDLFRQAYKL